MGELLGPDVIHDDDVSLPTINGYAYYEYSRRGMIRVSMRMYRAFPVLASGRQSGMTRWRDVAHPRYVEIVRGWSARSVEALSSAELMAGVVELLDAGTEYYTAVQTIIPVAASSEVIFTRFYKSLVQRAGDPPAGDLRARRGQQSDPGREVVVGPRRVDPRSSRNWRAGCWTTPRRTRPRLWVPMGRRGSTEPGRSGRPGSRRTWTRTATRSTTSTSSTRCRPTSPRR